MKKIFITIPWFLPAFRAGGPIRSIANLADNFDDADIWIFTSDTEVTGAALDGIETGKWVDYNEHTKVWYAAHGNISQQLTEQCNKVKPEILFIVGLYSWHFTMVPLMYCRVPKKIVSVRGMLHPGALSQKRFKKTLFLQAFKLLEYPHKVWFHATDEEEKTYIQSRLGSVAKVHIAGNLPAAFTIAPLAPKAPGELKLITLALVSPMKNILQVIRALESIEATVHYEIFGAIKDEDYWQQCRQAILHLPQNITVDYRGAVPFDTITGELRRNHVFIMPSESENFGHALYEALASGRPVITSSNTPWKDLKSHKAGANVNPAQLEEIASAIKLFADMDASDLAEWSLAASAYAQASVDRNAILADYKAMLAE